MGALVGAAAAWFAGRVQHRLETTFSMHREFHSPEMTRSRNMAGQTVRDNRSSSFEDMRVKLSPEVTQHVWNVMYFYQRLCLAVKLRDVHSSYIPEMFVCSYLSRWLRSRPGHAISRECAYQAIRRAGRLRSAPRSTDSQAVTVIALLPFSPIPGDRRANRGQAVDHRFLKSYSSAANRVVRNGGVGVDDAVDVRPTI